MMKKITILLLIMLTTGCSVKEKPIFIKVDAIKLLESNSRKITLTADALFKNPNDIGGHLNTEGVNVYVNDILMGFVSAEEFKVPANKDFRVPLQIDIDPKKLFDKNPDGFLGGLLNSVINQSLSVKYEGVINFKTFGFTYKYPISKNRSYKNQIIITHEHYIARCIEIAKNGLGTTAPNPMVGCVIVVKDEIIAEGYTSPYGGAHAEVNAINSVKNLELLKQATLYVTLEPCAHFGKTPPCSDLIIGHKIPKIVIGCLDEHDKVCGKGISKLKAAGCEVIVGVLEAECKDHHKRFLTYHHKKRPYIILKWAETNDGFIAPTL